MMVAKRVDKYEAMLKSLNHEIATRKHAEEWSALREYADKWASTATSYTNLVVVVGYAGLFSGWGCSDQLLSKDWRRWALVFGLTSAAAFVLNEVRNGYQSTRFVNALQRAVDRGEVDGKVKHWTAVFRLFRARSTAAWMSMFWLSLIFGLLSFATLAIGLVLKANG